MDICILLLYIFFVLISIFFCKEIVLKYLFMYVMFSYHILSVFIVENYSIYFKNLLETSYRTGALAPLVTFYIIYFSTIFVLERNNHNKFQNCDIKREYQYFLSFTSMSNRKRVKTISIILLLIVAMVLFKKRNIGFYSMNSIDRFDYAALTFSLFDTKFYTYIPWLLPVPLIAKNLGMKKIGYIFFALYLFYMIWVGDKFGSLFIAFYIFVLVTWTTKQLSKKKFWQMTMICGGAIVALMIFISLQVKYQWGHWSDIPIYFAHRLTGGQSDIWWKIFSMGDGINWRPGEFVKDEMTALITTPDRAMDYTFGIYKMMRVTAPKSVVDTYLRRGIRFAASTQATLYYYFDYLGLFVGSFMLAVLGQWIVDRAISSYRSSNIIKSVCYTMFLTKYISIIQMSEFRFLTSKTTLIAGFILLVTKILNRQYKRVFVT